MVKEKEKKVKKTGRVRQGMPEKWDYEADVVAIGYGFAGACAAIAAHDSGTEALIIEKMPEGFEGGNSITSAGNCAIPTNLAEAIEYYRALGLNTVTDEESIRAYAEAMFGFPSMMKKLGAELMIVPGASYFHNLPGWQCITGRYVIKKEGRRQNGVGLYQFFTDCVRNRKIKVMYNTPGKELLQDPMTKEILGVIAGCLGKEIFIKARKGIVLACGGYENNPEMQGQYNYPGVRLYPRGTTGNTGDGIKMAQKVGAALWHMNCIEGHGLSIKTPAELYSCAFSTRLGGSSIIVNKYGNRFMREKQWVGHFKGPLEPLYIKDKRIGKGIETYGSIEYPNLPFFLVFDETFRKLAPLEKKTSFGKIWHVQKNIYLWSKDNRAEIEKGWIVQADTIRELAAKMVGIEPTRKMVSVDPKGLEETVSKYNEYCAKGEDQEFGRPKEDLVPIESPPYYATELCISILNTMGGPKRNARLQVLNPDDKPIPRLYSAGELGSFTGFAYQGGSNIPEAITGGYIAGRNAADETPWEKHAQ